MYITILKLYFQVIIIEHNKRSCFFHVYLYFVSIATCDFEADFCGWTQDHTNDQFDWQRGRNGTGTANTGPPYDHTTRSEEGKYRKDRDQNCRTVVIKSYKAQYKL